MIDLDDFYAFKSTTKNCGSGGSSRGKGSGGGSNEPGCITWGLLIVSAIGLMMKLFE